MVDDSPTGNLFHIMCSRYCVSEIELLTNYKLFENSLRQTLYDGAEIILDILKEEMLQYVAIKNQTLTINDILEEINSKERRKDKRQKDKRTNTVLVKGHNTQDRISQKQFNRRARYSDLIGRFLV
jgi:predicted transcriptional regulator YheO